jgi:shikimate kinase
VKTDKLYVVGFMSAGKTSASRLLASTLSWEVADIDELIEARERLTVTEIFARFGEPYFRTAEREILRVLLPLRRTIVATGGGTFADAENRAAINIDGVSIWLDVPFAEILVRLPADGRRPLASDLSQLERLYYLRRPAYEQAHLRIDAGGATTPEIVERILHALSGSL